MRIGRDHIASSVYTLVFAYAGSAMTILLLIVAYQQSLLQIATTEQIAQEVVRTSSAHSVWCWLSRSPR